ncbi:ABC transporter permease [Mucilaginibacter sp. JRF]|uniref:ABC transporter permease n=1 Tax=Mucilaginibacter sp. JRF TaxID=2780088 RepID=UPI001881C279|nr:ABC transporter permease [Mucilaginibacter sp. JRF]MBE9586880.1 ABC transporter permease [Mucilaginibacter sp. JRF]
MIKNYFKTAWRSLWKHRVVSFINIGGLAVGMAAAVLIFMWVQNEFNFDGYHPNADNIYRIKNHLSIDKRTTWIWENSSYRMGEETSRQIPEVEKVTRIRPLNYAPTYFKIKGEFFPEKDVALIDSSWFDVFDYEFVSGGPEAFNSEPFSLILTESKAKKYFGNKEAVGQIIHIDTLDYKVQGVIKDIPANSSFTFDVLAPIASRRANPKEKENEMQWGNFYYITFLKLNPHSNTKKVAKKIETITAKARETNNLAISLTPLKDLHFESGLQNTALRQGNKRAITVFGALGVFLLVIACINYVNITTARASLRAKEVSIKKIVGAGRGTLFMQFVAESMVISLFALIFTVIIISASLPWFNNFTGRNFTLDPGNISLLVVVLGTLFFAVVLNSIYPALLLSSFKPLNTFRGISVLKLNDATLRKALVVVQFSFSILLIVGVITIYRQMSFIRSQNPGYNRSQVLSFGLPFRRFFRTITDEQRASTTQSIKNDLKALNMVTNVSLMAMSSIQNNDGQSSGGLDWDGREKDFDPAMAYFQVDADYMKIVNMKLKEGRWFDEGRKFDRKNAILNEAAVKELNLHKPYIGQRLVSRGDTGQVIGVVKDFNFKSLHEKIGPAIIKLDDYYSTDYLIQVAPGKQAEAIKGIQKIWDKYCPGDPFNYTFLDQEFDNMYKEDAKVSGLMSVFAIVAVIISCLGLFGLAAFTAEQRGKEIGIRKVLGASVSGIVTLLSKDFIYLVLISLVLASPLAWWLMNKWLQNFAYRAELQWWMFAMAGIIAIVIAFFTISFQAIKAAVVNPVKRLRSE